MTHVLLAAALAAAAPPRADATSPGRILVMPFENAARDSQLIWLVLPPGAC